MRKTVKIIEEVTTRLESEGTSCAELRMNAEFQFKRHHAPATMVGGGLFEPDDTRDIIRSEVEDLPNMLVLEEYLTRANDKFLQAENLIAAAWRDLDFAGSLPGTEVLDPIDLISFAAAKENARNSILQARATRSQIAHLLEKVAIRRRH
jgi:hypothetical protein